MPHRGRANKGGHSSATQVRNPQGVARGKFNFSQQDQTPAGIWTYSNAYMPDLWTHRPASSQGSTTPPGSPLKPPPPPPPPPKPSATSSHTERSPKPPSKDPSVAAKRKTPSARKSSPKPAFHSHSDSKRAQQWPNQHVYPDKHQTSDWTDHSNPHPMQLPDPPPPPPPVPYPTPPPDSPPPSRGGHSQLAAFLNTTNQQLASSLSRLAVSKALIDDGLTTEVLPTAGHRSAQFEGSYVAIYAPKTRADSPSLTEYTKDEKEKLKARRAEARKVEDMIAIANATVPVHFQIPGAEQKYAAKQLQYTGMLEHKLDKLSVRVQDALLEHLQDSNEKRRLASIGS